jgi:hypothetical protein
MTRIIRLHQLADYFPVAPLPAPATFPLLLANNLQNRLITLALGLGAIEARFDLTCAVPTLVVRSSRGNEIRTTITGAEWEWHKALDEFSSLYDEDERAGLNRFLGIRQTTPQSRGREPQARRVTNFDALMLMAA